MILFLFLFFYECHVKMRLSDSPTVRRSERPTGAASGWKCSRASLVVQEVLCYLNRFRQPEGILKKKQEKKVIVYRTLSQLGYCARKGSIEKKVGDILLPRWVTFL